MCRKWRDYTKNPRSDKLKSYPGLHCSTALYILYVYYIIIMSPPLGLDQLQSNLGKSLWAQIKSSCSCIKLGGGDIMQLVKCVHLSVNLCLMGICHYRQCKWSGFSVPIAILISVNWRMGDQIGYPMVYHLWSAHSGCHAGQTVSVSSLPVHHTRMQFHKDRKNQWIIRVLNSALVVHDNYKKDYKRQPQRYW